VNTKHCLMFLAGVGCGASIALLLAPDSGANLRTQIAGKAASGHKALKSSLKETAEAVQSAVKRRAEVVDHTINEGVAAFNEAREVYLNT
jgi:gas vesicle protein